MKAQTDGNTIRRKSKSESCSVCPTLCEPRELYSPWNSPGQNTGVGSLSLFRGIFPTQGSNPGPQHCRQILYQLSHKGSPRVLEWVAYPFSSRSSWPRNWTGVSRIAGGFFYQLIRKLTLILIAMWIKTKQYNQLPLRNSLLVLLITNRNNFESVWSRQVVLKCGLP